MKKTFALLLALCLLLCGTALADDVVTNTKEIKYDATAITPATDTTELKLDVAQDCVVTIPTSLTFTLDDDAGTCTTSDVVKVTSRRLGVGKKLVVKLTGATSASAAGNTANTLRLSTSQGEALLPYSISKSASDVITAINAQTPWEVLSVEWDDETATPETTLTFAVLPDTTTRKVEITVAGSYTDTLTFSVSIEDIATGND